MGGLFLFVGGLFLFVGGGCCCVFCSNFCLQISVWLDWQAAACVFQIWSI